MKYLKFDSTNEHTPKLLNDRHLFRLVYYQHNKYPTNFKNYLNSVKYSLYEDNNNYTIN